MIERRPIGSTIVYTSAQEGSEAYDEQWLKNFGVIVIRDKSKILLPTPRVAWSLRKIIRDKGIEVAAFGAAAPLALLSAPMKAAGIKRTVALTHGHEVWWSKLFPFNLLMRRIGATTDSLTYLGDFTRKAISGALSKESQEAMVKIAPGIDIDHFRPVDSTQLRAELGLSNKKVIVSVGRLVHRKGQDHLVQSMPAILAAHPEAHLLLVGKGPYLEHLAKLVAKNGLQDSVSFIGRIQYAELPAYICCGDIFAMPSRSRLMGLEVEGLGIVYLEASACGLPVIAGKSGGAPDAVIDGTTGVVVDGTNNNEIAKAAIDLLSDPEHSRKMGEAGRKWIAEQWRWQIWSEKFEELLSK